MIELPFIFVAGLLGSAHCIGMCGPFALSIGGVAPSWRVNLLRQLVYTSGRLFTYAVFGAVAGYAGWRLTNSLPILRNSAAFLSVAAGLFLIYQGAATVGLFRKKQTTGGAGPCLAGTFLGSFLKSPSWTNTFLAGLFTGMLPCGLVYGFVALAAGTGDLAAGILLMIAFGLGTAPVMILTGIGGSMLGMGVRKHLFRIAAWCVIVTGFISIARGVGYVEIPGWVEPTGCPACAAEE